MREIKWEEVDGAICSQHVGDAPLLYLASTELTRWYVLAGRCIDGYTKGEWYILEAEKFGPDLTDDEKEAACNLARIIYETRRKKWAHSKTN